MDTPYEIPEDVTQIEDLEAAEQAALDAAQALEAVEDPDEAQLQQLERLADHVEAIRAEGEARGTAAEDRRARAEAARNRLNPPEDSTDPDAEPDADPDAEPDAGGGDADPDADADDPDAADDPQAVAAGGKKRRRSPSLIRNRRQPDNPRPQTADRRVTIVAAAGIQNVEAGSELDGLDAVTAAFQARARSHPSEYVSDMYSKHTVATFSRGMGDLSMENPLYAGDQQALLDAAARESDLPNGSLAAAGGWCAPSTTLYDLVEMETAEGLIDLPEVGVSRGGIRSTIGPDFADIYAGVGFSQTEAQAIAGTAKGCFEVACPPFTETRLDAVGICVKSPILTNAGYPELVRRVISGSLIAHQHKMSAKAIAAMATALGTATVVPTYGSTFRNLLSGLELAAEGQRYARRLGVNATLEVVLPQWVRSALRDDLQARQRQADPVTNEQLDSHFRERNLRVQFVYGYADTRIVDPPGTALCLSDWPDTVPAMMYPAGTFVKGVADVISLDTLYDSTNLDSNMYTAAFVEEGMLIARRAPGGCNLTFVVDNSGSVGPADLPSWGITDV